MARWRLFISSLAPKVDIFLLTQNNSKMFKNIPQESIRLNGYKVNRPNSDELEIRKNRVGSIFPFFIISAFFIIWYWGLLSSVEGEGLNIIEKIFKLVSDEPFLIIFIIAPIVIIFPILLKLGRINLNLDNYYIDAKRGIIKKNNRFYLSFADIKKLILPKNSGAISFITDTNKKVEFLKANDRVGIRRIANILAEMTKITISTN